MLTLDSVGKSFGGRTVLKSAWMRADAGAITLLLGRNGAGKSTLLRIAAGLLAADHGHVTFRGTTYLRPRPAALARRGLVFIPDRRIFFSGPPLGSQLAAAARRGAPEGWKDLLARTVAALRLGDLLSRPARTLSGGEVRRANLALGLVLRPRCLLLDEPLRSAAPLDSELLVEAIRSLAREGGAVVVTGHDVGVLMEMGDQVVWVHSGTCTGLGSPEAARGHPGFRRGYAPGV